MNHDLISGDKFEILIVDDAMGVAEDYAKLIHLKYDLRIASTDDPEKAMDILKSNPIRVAVLDQVMPVIPGTELFKKMKQINPQLKVLMFSAEAGSKDYVQASELGYDGLLEKSRITDLPDRVFALYTKFHVEQAERFKADPPKRLLRIRESFFSFSHVEYFISKTKILDDKKIFDEEWKTVSELNAGQEREIEESLEFSEKIKFERSITTKLSAEFGLSAPKLEMLKAKIKKEISTSETYSTEEKRSVKKSIKSVYKLPAQPADIDQKYIVKRKIEVAPVYLEISAILYKKCNFCQSCIPYHLVFYKQKAEYASRQIDNMSDGEEEVIETGITRL